MISVQSCIAVVQYVFGYFQCVADCLRGVRVLWICNVWVSFCFRIATVFYLWVSEASESGSETVRGECLSWIVRFMMCGDDELDRWNSVYVLHIVA